MLLRMLSACAPCTRFWINPTAYSGQNQDPSNETIAGLSRFSLKNTTLSCYSANHVVFKCSLEPICTTMHAWQIDRQTVDQTEAKQLRQCQGILEDSYQARP